MKTADPDAIAAEIETLIGRISACGDRSAAHAQELVQLLMSLYGAGLSRVLEIVRTEQGGPSAVLDRLGTDPLLASLLVLHDLHPHPVDARVRRALDGLAPHLGPGTQLALVSAEETTVRVRVEPPGAGGTHRRDTIRTAIERAVREAAPECESIHVEGLDEPLLQITRPRAAGSPTA